MDLLLLKSAPDRGKILSSRLGNTPDGWHPYTQCIFVDAREIQRLAAECELNLGDIQMSLLLSLICCRRLITPSRRVLQYRSTLYMLS